MTLELLVGPIASGKSTYCREAAKNGSIIVNDDSIVTSAHGGDYHLYNKALKPFYKSIENHMVSTALAIGLNVVIDRPNHSISMRRRFIAIAKSFDIPVTLIMFKRESPEVHASRRFNSDSRGHSLEYWIDAARYHESLYESPNQEIELFDKIVNYEITH